MKNGNNYNALRERGIDNWNLAGKVINLSGNNSKNLEKIGVPKKQGHVYNKNSFWKQEVDYMIKTAKTHEDLDNIGQKINYAIDNKMYSVGITDLQVKASKKMREIYNKIGEPQ